MKFLRFLLETNIYIALAAMLLTMETQIQLGLPPQWHPYLFIVFFATMFEYNFHKLITIVIKKQALDNDKNRWIKNHLNLFYAMVLFSVIGFGVAIILAKKVVLIALAPIAAITIFYSFPLFRKNNFIFRLREVPLLKIFLIAMVWSFATILLPFIYSDQSYAVSDVTLMLLERFVFVVAITIPFDIRDMDVDTRSGITTIPLLLGEKRSIEISILCLLIFVGLSVFHYFGNGKFHVLSAFILSAISTFYFITSRKMQKQENYYYGILDGTMLIQGVLVILFYFLWMNVNNGNAFT